MTTRQVLTHSRYESPIPPIRPKAGRWLKARSSRVPLMVEMIKTIITKGLRRRAMKRHMISLTAGVVILTIILLPVSALGLGTPGVTAAGEGVFPAGTTYN